MRRIAVMNAKGGSAKSTTATALAVGMARRGMRALLVDSDAQHNSSMTLLDGHPAEPPTLGHVLLGQADVEDAIRPTRIPGLDILPADAQLADAALLLADQIGREHRFRRALGHVDGDHDALVVDCPPQMSLVTVNVLAAVDEVIVPVDAGIYSVAGLAQLQKAVADVREYLGNATLRISGLVLTKCHANRATRDIAEQIRAAFGPLVYRTSIPHSVRVEEAHARHLTILEFSPASAPAKAYNDLLTEVLGDGDQQQGSPDDLAGPDATDDAGPAAGRGGAGHARRGRGSRRAG
jgi:chromosome partitioning protein